MRRRVSEGIKKRKKTLKDMKTKSGRSPTVNKTRSTAPCVAGSKHDRAVTTKATQNRGG